MKLVQGQVLIKIIFSTLVIPALFLVFSLAFARQEARIFLHPIDIVARTVTLDIIVENATDLYGAEFRASLLRAHEAVNGVVQGL